MTGSKKFAGRVERSEPPSRLRPEAAKNTRAARFEVRNAGGSGGTLRPVRAGAILERAGVHNALHEPGRPLNEGVRPAMESRLGFDFSKVRIHTDARAADSARWLNAQAYTVGSHVVFGRGQYDPISTVGQRLLAHELTHVAQQGGRNAAPGAIDAAADSAHELEADRFAGSFLWGSGRMDASVHGRVSAGTVQRKIEMRNRGARFSGFPRAPELITRLNGISTGLTFSLDGLNLKCDLKQSGHLSNFDRQMKGFIDQAAVIPMLLTNRHGLLGNRTGGFHTSVTEDAWSSGYVDIDDLLASSDLGLQEVLVHFLRERTATSNYAGRIGTESLNTDPASAGGAAHQAEFDHAHAQGIQAELAVLQDFFNDPLIRLINADGEGEIFRVYRNSRRDTIRTRVRSGTGRNAGVDPVTIEVVTRDGRVHTPEEYRAILAAAPPPGVAGAAGGAAAAHAP
ncbi:MAG: DUF4157 domain-containing protein [Terracidiphilus sp.]